ncbi:MAG TPA: hypothetical protein PK354_08360 [bacterium]|nr:hypothetical protein [bacterium]
MNRINVLLSPPVAFVIIAGLFTCLYIIAGKIAASSQKSKGKVSTYACGEDMPGFKFQIGYGLFFIFALFFTIMHVAALVVATLPAVSPAVFFGIFYLAAIFLSVLSMVFYVDNQESENKLTKDGEGD